MRALRVVEFLLADRIGINQCAVAIQARVGLPQIRLRASERGFGIADRGLEGCRIDLVQRCPGPHFTALIEQTPLHDAADAGAHLGTAYGLDSAGQFGHVRDLFRRDADGRDICGRRSTCAWSGCGRFLVAAGGQ